MADRKKKVASFVGDQMLSGRSFSSTLKRFFITGQIVAVIVGVRGVRQLDNPPSPP